MIILSKECEHCKQDYLFQASGGTNELEIPRIYQDPNYCPECKKAMVEALFKIKPKFKYKYVETNEVTINMCLQWKVEENLEWVEKNKITPQFPLIEKVFAQTWDTSSNEQLVTKHVKGRGEFKGKEFTYSYYPSKRDGAVVRILTKIKID